MLLRKSFRMDWMVIVDVRLALNICGFPPDLPQEIISEILRGGADKVAEAGAPLAGGHTINDKEDESYWIVGVVKEGKGVVVTK